MSPQPRIEHRDEQSYVGIRTTTTMDGLAGAIDRHFRALFGWLQSHGLEPSAAPFIRYERIDMGGELELELAVPVAPGVEVPPDGQADEQVRSGVLPAGRYVTLLHVGPYDELLRANAALQEWAKEQGIRWQMTDDSRWTARVEQYLTDPSREPDPSRLETELAYLAADD